VLAGVIALIPGTRLAREAVTGLRAAVTAGPSCAPGTNQVVSVPDPAAPQSRRQVVIHRPPGPDRADIPVLYLLHGYPGDPQSTLDGVSRLLDAQMCRTGRPFVVAAPDGEAGNVDTEWGDDPAGRFAVESFVTEAVIDATEGSQRRSRALRAIGGFSMGGYGAAALALRHPQLYSEVASFGGYYRLDDPDGVFAGDDTDHAPDRLVSAATAGQLRFFLVEGAQEDTALQNGSIRGEAERFTAILHRNGVTVGTAHPPGGHDGDGWYPALGDCVDFLTAGWTGHG
jgi:pimeloyl-ACP methyl ester carboxylesterase